MDPPSKQTKTAMQTMGSTVFTQISRDFPRTAHSSLHSPAHLCSSQAPPVSPLETPPSPLPSSAKPTPSGVLAWVKGGFNPSTCHSIFPNPTFQIRSWSLLIAALSGAGSQSGKVNMQPQGSGDKIQAGLRSQSVGLAYYSKILPCNVFL